VVALRCPIARCTVTTSHPEAMRTAGEEVPQIMERHTGYSGHSACLPPFVPDAVLVRWEVRGTGEQPRLTDARLDELSEHLEQGIGDVDLAFTAVLGEAKFHVGAAGPLDLP
jgi:hypothetical protein